MALVEVQVPDIGDFDEVTVIELLVKPGDTVKAEQSLITVESDKASMEIPSAAAGVVKELRVKLGDKVKQGSLVVMLESTATSSPSGQNGSPPPQPSPVPVEGAKPFPSAVSEAKPAVAQVNTAQAAITTVATTSGPIEVRVPDIGDFKDVSVIEVLVKPGDTIKLEQSLITVESDKASMEIPSGAAGVLTSLAVKVGDVVNIGDLLGVLEGVATASPSPQPSPHKDEGAKPVLASAAPDLLPVPHAKPEASLPGAGEGRGEGHSAPTPSPTVQPHNPTETTTNLPHASPSIRKFARELGVPLGEVKGTGIKGRITEADVQAFTQAVMAGTLQTKAIAAATPAKTGGGGGELNLLAWPKVDFTKFGPTERKELSRIKKISGANLHRNWVVIPHVTNHDDADITELEAFRVSTNKENEKSGLKVTMLAFLIKACVSALKKFPDFNSSLDGDQLVLKQYFHIGFAADTPNGLVVPVIKDADKKGVLAISKEMGELAGKAREGKLTPAEMSGACFTISSLGGIGGRYFTPIINAPEVAILGVCKSNMEPVWDGEKFVPRLMLPLSLSWDHRVIDGASAARFNAYLGQILGDFRRVLL